MNRRGFLGAILAGAAAPVIITTPGLLMPVRPIWTPPRLSLPAQYGGVYRFTEPDGLEDAEIWAHAQVQAAAQVYGFDPSRVEYISIPSMGLPGNPLGQFGYVGWKYTP